MNTIIGSVKKPVFGRVVSVSRHRNANKLYIAIVDVAREQYIQIIFGGDTILCSGDTVAVALPGTRLPSGEKIRARNYRGMRSYAEILSRDELFGTIGGPDEILLLQQYSNRIGESIDIEEYIALTDKEVVSRADRIKQLHYRKVHHS